MEYSNKTKLEKAKKRVKDIKGFYTHLMVYLVINIMLFVFRFFFFEAVTGIRVDVPDWSYLTTPIGWGIGLFFHWFMVFKYSKTFAKGWEERKIKEFMEKDKEDYGRME